MGKKEPGSPETWLETIKVILGPEEEGHSFQQGIRPDWEETWRPLKLQGHEEPWYVKFWALKQTSIPGVLTEPDVKTHKTTHFPGAYSGNQIKTSMDAIPKVVKKHK